MNLKYFVLALILIQLGDSRQTSSMNELNALMNLIKLAGFESVLNTNTYLEAITKCQNISLLEPITLLKMIDATAKTPSGLLVGNQYNLGNFDECYGIETETPRGIMYGKYCLSFRWTLDTILSSSHLNLNFINIQKVLESHPEVLGHHLAVCIPSWCSAEEITGDFIFVEEYCYSKNTAPKFTMGSIMVIVVFGVILTIVLVSTVYDIICIVYPDTKEAHKLLRTFSVIANGRKLLDTSSEDSAQILCLNGIKSLSMLWVILGHNFVYLMFAPISNFKDVLTWKQQVVNMTFIGGTVAVDSFFLVGGLVNVYTFLKSSPKWNKSKLFIRFLHRYIRLTPVLATIVVVHLYLAQHLGTGPLWVMVDTMVVKSCQNGWWSSLLYITNYVEHKDCVPQAWYLTVDMQLFFLSPLILIPLVRRPKFALKMLGVLSIMAVIIPFSIAYIHELSPFVIFDENYNNVYYYQTYARFGPYVIGMVLGYLIYKLKYNKEKPKLNSLVVCLLWIISLLGLAACVYGGHGLLNAETYDRLASSIFIGFNRQAWALALSILIFLCVTGHGGPIDIFLSNPFFTILSKLSYSMYMLHVTVITLRMAATRDLAYFSNINAFQNFGGYLLLMLPLSVVMYLVLEAPIISLEKYVFGRRKKTNSSYE